MSHVLWWYSVAVQPQGINGPGKCTWCVGAAVHVLGITWCCSGTRCAHASHFSQSEKHWAGWPRLGKHKALWHATRSRPKVKRRNSWSSGPLAGIDMLSQLQSALNDSCFSSLFLQCASLDFFRAWELSDLTGLMSLHQMFVIHADLKPGNILIFDEDVLQICDLGCSQPNAPWRSSPTSSETEKYGIHLVTLNYRAPEILLGNLQLRRDIVWDVHRWACVHGNFTDRADFPDTSTHRVRSNF